jgi:TolB protein
MKLGEKIKTKEAGMILCFKTRIFPALLIVLLTIINIELAYAERIYLDISAPDVRKLVVAIPAFKDQGSGSADTVTGREMAALLGRALDFHGFVKVADPKVYGSATTAEWKKYGVDFVVRGHFIKRGTELIIEGRLEDVDNRVLSGKRYKGQVVQRDDMVLRLADGLVKEFTGVPGISRTRIAYTSDKNGAKDIFISDVLGRSHRQVTRHRFLCVSPRFTEDGNFLAYTTYHRGNQDLYITDLRQDKVTRSLSRRKGMNLAPAFSPDGKTMVVTLSKNGNPDLYLMDRTGKIIERLTSRAGINVSADFSPDGKSLVFVSDRSGQPQLYTMNMKTRAVQRLTFEGRENSEPSWSPKGDLIAYTGMVDGRYHIFTIKPGGGRSVRLTSAWGDYESPDWSPDGKQLAFSRQRNGHSEILTMFANGKGMRVLFPLEGNQTSPRWSPPSDDS